MLEVWGRRNASNVIPVMWTVGELEIPHVRHDVGGSFGGLDGPDYRAMNPNGRIPTIVNEGFALWESNAIVRYLARRYGRGSLLPEDEGDCARADQWMVWCKTTPYGTYIDLFWAIVRTEPDLRDAAAIGALAERLGESLKILDAQLADHPFVAGEHLTMADMPFGPMIHRYLNLEIARPRLPHVEAWYERIRERPAFREHVMLPFGRNPAEWYLLERGGAV